MAAVEQLGDDGRCYVQLAAILFFNKKAFFVLSVHAFKKIFSLIWYR